VVNFDIVAIKKALAPGALENAGFAERVPVASP
jgi:hypothetical protein